MLILTRKRNDSIRIGENIVVRVMRTAKGSVKIGIEAPDSVRIVRGEILSIDDPANASHDEHDDNLLDDSHHDEDADEPVLIPVEMSHEMSSAEALMLQH